MEGALPACILRILISMVELVHCGSLLAVPLIRDGPGSSPTVVSARHILATSTTHALAKWLRSLPNHLVNGIILNQVA